MDSDYVELAARLARLETEIAALRAELRGRRRDPDPADPAEITALLLETGLELGPTAGRD